MHIEKLAQVLCAMLHLRHEESILIAQLWEVPKSSGFFGFGATPKVPRASRGGGAPGAAASASDDKSSEDNKQIDVSVAVGDRFL